jgi:hypothetical protein
MNATLKTVLLTLLTLSCLTIALIELMGISRNAFFRKLEGPGFVRETIAQESNDSPIKATRVIPATEIDFVEDFHDFGKIKDGTTVNHVFQFKNTGAHPLVIDEVVATCGCTIPAYTKTPVPPGETGEISFSFNSTGRVGNVDKEIYVRSNAQNPNIPLRFKAIVIQ